MTPLLSIPAFLLLTLPWLNPFAPGPSPAVVPWLVALAATGGVLGLGSMRNLAAQGPETQTFAQRWAPPFAWALLVAGLVSSAMGLLQYFGVAAALEPWVRQGTPGEAFANLRQRNQFATLTNMALVALAGLVANHRTALTADGLACRVADFLRGRGQPALWLMAALLAAGNAASLSRTGLLQLVTLCGLYLLWGRWRERPVRHLLVVAVAVYAVAIFALPWLAGLDPFGGMFTRLRDGAPACGSRLLLWSNVLHLMAEKPWLGWGWNELDFAHYTTLYNGPRFCEILDNAHNLPLHLAVELGLPLALLACGAVLWWVLRRKPWREADPARQMAWGVLAVIGLHSLLEYPLWYGPFQMAAGWSVALLWRQNNPVMGAKFKPNRSLAQVLYAPAAIILIATSTYAAWDYHRVSQLYLAPSARDEAYRDDTLGKARVSRLFHNQVAFAELVTTPLTRSNAQWTFDTARALLHYSPEPRVIEKVIESAVMLGRDDEALAQLQRFKAAFPKEHAAWVRSNARMPAVLERLNPSR